MATKVNVPVDPKIKERDINNKLQLYGIYSAFANGKVPSNQQIDVALNSFLESKALATPSKKLSPEGQELVKEFRDVVEKAKHLLLTKNEGNLLQDFIWQTQQLDQSNFNSPNAPLDKGRAKQHGQDALGGLRTLGTLIISNGQFRKLLEDAAVLLRAIGSDAATKAATKLGPDEDKLNRIDEPAPDDTWHEVPDLSNVKGQVKDAYSKNKPFSRADVQEAAGDASAAAHPAGERDPAATADLAATDAQTGGNSGVDGAAGVGAAAGNLQEKAKQNVPEDTKQKAEDLKNSAQERRARLNRYLKGQMPQERREQTIWRLKKMVVEIQGHQDYLEAINTLLGLAEEYAGHSKALAGQGKDSVKGLYGDNKQVLTPLKTLIERFANGSSLDDLADSINQIYRDADQDPELRGWFKSMDTYIRKILKEQGYILEDASTEEWNQLYDQGHALLREKYRGHTDRIIDEFKYIGKQFDADPQNKAFSDSVKKLCLDLGQDGEGHPTFKPHLLKDISEVIVPAIFENIRYVPIPRIEYQDPMMDAVIENLVLEGDNLAPNVFEFSTDNHFRWGRKKIASKNKNKIMVSVSGIQADLRDVAYHIKKKQGFPSITDTGVMDIHLGGEGFSFKIEMENADPKDRQHFFKINKVDVKVKHFTIKVKQSKHKLLLTLAKPLLLKVIRPALQKVAEKQLKENAEKLDEIIYQIKVEADKAQRDFKNNPDPENAQNIYQRYVTAANKQIMQGKQKKQQLQDRAKDTKVNMAVTQKDSIFPDVKLPGGISSKATEYKELAGKGDKWESPIFSLGSAKETSNLAKAPEVTRKSGTNGAIGTNGSAMTNGAAGLRNQMDQAFDGSNTTAATNGKAVNGSANGHTTLGENNPVLTGAA